MYMCMSMYCIQLPLISRAVHLQDSLTSSEVAHLSYLETSLVQVEVICCSPPPSSHHLKNLRPKAESVSASALSLGLFVYRRAGAVLVLVSLAGSLFPSMSDALEPGVLRALECGTCSVAAARTDIIARNPAALLLLGTSSRRVSAAAASPPAALAEGCHSSGGAHAWLLLPAPAVLTTTAPAAAVFWEERMSSVW